MATPNTDQFRADPRLSSPSSYSLEASLAALTSLYHNLPHIDPGNIKYPPPTGWPEITAESLEAKGLKKTDEAVELLRHLPYITSPYPWITSESFVLDYLGLLRDKGNKTWLWELSGYEGSSLLPPWGVQISTGVGACLRAYFLDTSDGTVTRYDQQGWVAEITYPDDDPRRWRNYCDDETEPLDQFVKRVQSKFRELEWMCLPGDHMGFPSVLVHQEDAEPGSYMYDETRKIHEIYREHGWPDEYRGQECRAAVERYWRHRND